MDAVNLKIMDSNYRYERLTSKHYNDLIYISKSAFNISPDLSYYKLKNATEKFGTINLGFIAYHNETNEPAAFYGVYSYPVSYQDKIYKAVQSGDTMTHKNHTGKGLFIKLAKLTYELAKNEGAQFVFGFPNSNSYPGFVKKLNWIHRENMKMYKLKISTLPLLKVVKKLPFLNGLYALYFSFVVKLVGGRANPFENSCSEPDNCSINHDVDFWKYKRYSGSKLVSIGKYKVWLKADGFLFIGDIKRESETHDLLSKLKRFAFFIGSDVVLFGVSPDSFWDLKLKQELNPEEGLAYGYLKFNDEFPAEKLSYVFADSDTF